MDKKMLEGINLSRLWTLSLIRETGTVKGAARSLFVTPQAVTLQIKALERALGVSLLERRGRGVSLTPAGRIVEATGREMISRVSGMRRRIADLQSSVVGSVRIGAHTLIGNYLLPSILPRFIAGHPGVRLELRSVSVGELDSSVLNGSVDLAYFLGVFDAEKLHVTPTGFERLVLVASPDHPLVQEEPVSAERLAESAFIAPHGSSAWKSILEQELLQLGMMPRNMVVELGSIEAMREAAAQGVGVTVLFESAVRGELREGVLRPVHLRGFAPRVPIYRVQHPELPLTAAARELAGYIDREIARRA
jgi:DNA-binding transcriptional LysR family regulator